MACWPVPYHDGGKKIVPVYKNPEKDFVCKKLYCNEICAVSGNIGGTAATGFFAVKSGDQVVDLNTTAVLTGWTTSAQPQQHDADAQFNEATGVWTVPSTGLWAVAATVTIDGTADIPFRIDLDIDVAEPGTDQTYSTFGVIPSANSTVATGFVTLSGIQLVAGDTVTLSVGGATANQTVKETVGGAITTWFSATSM